MENTHAVKDTPAKASSNHADAKPNFDAYIMEKKPPVEAQNAGKKPDGGSLVVPDVWSHYVKKPVEGKPQDYNEVKPRYKCGYGNNKPKPDAEDPNKCMNTRPVDNAGTRSTERAFYGGMGALGGVGMEGLRKLDVVTEKERAAAQGRLTDTILKSVPKEDQKSVAMLGGALLGGEVKGFAEALRLARLNHKDMDKVLNELNASLKMTGSMTSVSRDQRGQFVVTSTTSDTAMKFNVKEGTFGVYQAERQRDGSVAIGDELVNTVPAKQFRRLSDNAVDNIDFARNIKHFGFAPATKPDQTATVEKAKDPEQKPHKYLKEKNIGEQVGDWINETKKNLGWDK